MTGSGLRLGVLGPLTVNGQPGGLLPAQAQLLVALALHSRDGLSNQRLCYLLGADADHPKPTGSLRQLIVRTRRQLGRPGDGRQWIEHLGSGQYGLHPGVSVDWNEFDSMATAGLADSDARPLSRALALVRGQPLAGCYYWWLDVATVESIRARIVAAADVLSGLALEQGDLGMATRACWAGLAADATAERLWRSLLRAQEASGNLAGLRETWNRCLAAIAEVAPGCRPHPETTALYTELLASPSSHHRG